MRYVNESIVILFLLLLVPVVVHAHGTSVKLDKQSAAPGETITVKGEGISSNGEIKLSLRGMQDYTLGTARGDEHGRFEQKVTVPADIQPGDYSFLAEGEKTASARLKIVAGQGGDMGDMKLPPASQEHEEGMPGMEMVSNAKPGPMEVQRPGGREAIARWAIVLLSLLAGVVLRRSGKRATPKGVAP